jgi:perosamine synthetase
MSLSPLAIFGGTPVCREAWPSSNTIGKEEKKAVLEVLDSGVLSQFLGAPGPDFLGGTRVRQLEMEWAEHFGTKHALSFNSLTSGLQACIGAAGIEPGDEVIVPPLTMSASATCVITYGGIPVFADVDPRTLCLDPASVEEKITDRTRAIVVVHLFGHPADMDGLMAVARRHGLMVIEDAAQAPGAMYGGRPVGTIGELGGFSLNYHKTIQSGEGGVIVTNDDELAQRLSLIRNHGEMVVESLGVENLANTFGGNLRMTEIEAAIALEQLRKLEVSTRPRIDLASYLDERIVRFHGIEPQGLSAPEGSSHVYYFYAMFYDEEEIGLPRSLFAEAVRAEGIHLREWYAPPVYWAPMYRDQVAFGKSGFPFVSEYTDREFSYERGICPVAEEAYEQNLIFGKFCHWPLTTEHMDQVVEAMDKVLAHRDDLLTVEQRG